MKRLLVAVAFVSATFQIPTFADEKVSTGSAPAPAVVKSKIKSFSTAKSKSTNQPLSDKPLNGSCTTGGQRKAILGMATMAADGSIVAPIESPGPTHTASILRLKPGDPEYESFLEHIGGLKPGETKPLPVWDTPGPKK